MTKIEGSIDHAKIGTSNRASNRCEGLGPRLLLAAPNVKIGFEEKTRTARMIALNTAITQVEYSVVIMPPESSAAWQS
jgi:hypothetical protein